MIRWFFGWLVLAGAVGSAACERGPAADPTAERIVRSALATRRSYETLAELTDRIGPRLSGSANLDAAVRWSEDQLKRAGADRVWTEKVLVPHWVRGVETARIVAPVGHPIAVTALGGSDPTPQAGLSAHVVEAASFADLHALGDRARGAIVLFNRPIHPNGGEERGYGSAVGLRYRGAIEASRAGAAGMIVRSLGTASFRLPHTGSMAYEPGIAHVPAAAISAEDADLVHRLLASGERVRIELTLGCRTLPDVESANVLADLRGRSRPDEIVLIGAHLDSWDLGTGAIDDGAGVAIVIEAIRLLAALGVRPRRTIRAVLFTNEENGLRGGRAYAEAHRDEVSRHVAAIESDGGAARPLGFSVTGGFGAEAGVARIAAGLRRIGAAGVTTGGGGADIGPLAEAGGVPLIELRQDMTHYFDYHHTAADTLDKVDPTALAKNVAALAVVAWGLAEAETTLPRTSTRAP